MILKVDIFFSLCVFSVYSDIYKTTENNEYKSLKKDGVHFQNSESIYFKVKSCDEAFIDLVDDSSSTEDNNPVYRVHFEKEQSTIIENSSESILANETWSGLDCNCYVFLWVSWIKTIEAGKGTMIGSNKFIRSTAKIDVIDILIMSHTVAYWQFNFPKNATSACTPDPTTMINTTTTTQGLEATTISNATTTTQELEATTISNTTTATDGLETTTISNTTTTTQGLDPTTTTLGLDPTTTINTTKTTQGLDPTTTSNTKTTVAGFDPTTLSTIITTTTKSKTRQTIDTTDLSCICSCNNFTLDENELITKIALLKSELSVDKKQTNKYRRSLISTADDRSSSKYIGTFSIVVLVVIFSMVVLMDFQHYAPFVFHKKK